MHRMDKQLQWMSMNEANNVVRPEDVAARETELLPFYQPLGELFSDLHDRCGLSPPTMACPIWHALLPNIRHVLCRIYGTGPP
eukprot:3318497-Prymnesium_polylepis.1